MFNKFNLVKNYLKYWFVSKDEHSLHSPFLFNFYTQCIQNKIDKNHFKEIEQLRTSLLNDSSEILVTDFGAGSKLLLSNKRKIADIAKNSLSTTGKCILLYKIVNFINPNQIIELGTSLGIATSYLALKQKKVYTLEGCPNIATKAQNIFNQLNLYQIQLIQGNINQTFPELLCKLDSIDIIFFDGNHTEKATLKYYDMALPKINENTLFIFDDIYWSKGMQNAWEKICSKPEVMISIDLFDIGLVFFRNNQPKQHFVLKW